MKNRIENTKTNVGARTKLSPSRHGSSLPFLLFLNADLVRLFLGIGSALEVRDRNLYRSRIVHADGREL